MKHFYFRSDANIWRHKVYVYDANRQPLDHDAGGPYISSVGGWVWDATNTFYWFQTNVGVAASRLVITSTTVKYVRFVFYSGSSVTSTPFAFAELLAFLTAPNGDQLVDFIRRQTERPLFVTGTTPPSESLLRRGEQIMTDTGMMLVTHRIDTTLSVAAVSTNTTITVTSAAGIASGDNIAILLDDDTTHFTTVNGAPAGNLVTLAAAMAGAAATGKNVATNRFLHVT